MIVDEIAVDVAVMMGFPIKLTKRRWVTAFGFDSCPLQVIAKPKSCGS